MNKEILRFLFGILFIIFIIITVTGFTVLRLQVVSMSDKIKVMQMNIDKLNEETKLQKDIFNAYVNGELLE